MLQVLAGRAAEAGIAEAYGDVAHAALLLVALAPGGAQIESKPVGLRFADWELGKQRWCK